MLAVIFLPQGFWLNTFAEQGTLHNAHCISLNRASKTCSGHVHCALPIMSSCHHVMIHEAHDTLYNPQNLVCAI